MDSAERGRLMAEAARHRGFAQEDYNAAVRDHVETDAMCIAYHQGEAIITLLTVIAEQGER